ncbi:MAG TPA: acyl carrier protein [Bryobacteraceae bacterium]|jgi:acyl carrier protein|nr:acyl carrier protein [Bryobacteraceae bacterium]
MSDHLDSLDAVLNAIRDVTGVNLEQPDQDFYDAGVTSVQALPLLLELEERFQVSIPDDQFVAARSARRLSEMIQDISKRECA